MSLPAGVLYEEDDESDKVAAVRIVRVESTVTVQDDEGDHKYTIVENPEVADPARGLINRDSPIAKALLGGVEGDVVRVRVPNGVRTVKILSVSQGE